METAKIFMNGQSQAVRLPKEFRFDCDEVIVKKQGKMVILIDKKDMWDNFLDGVNGFTDDFMADGRELN